MTTSSLTDPLGGLTGEQWDDLAGAHFYSTSAWLTYCADNNSGRTGAALSVTDGSPTSAVPVSEITEVLSGAYGWNGLLEGFGLPQIAPTGLMLGILQGYQTHLLSAAHADPVAAAGVLTSEARRLRDSLPDPQDKACVAMYLTTADVLAAREAGVRSLPVLLDADAWIDLPDGGWDSWLETLPYRRRLSARREVRRFEEAGYQVTHRPLSECYQELAKLAKATQSKYGHAQDLDFYAGLLKAHVTGMGEAARVAVCAREDGDPVGFCVYYEWQGTVFLRWAGFDYTRTAEAAEYFNLVYYTQIMRSPQSGIQRLHAGTKATEAKALRGATIQPLWLLDLDNDGPLARSTTQIREHNHRLASTYLDDPRIAPAITDRDAWTVFG